MKYFKTRRNHKSLLSLVYLTMLFLIFGFGLYIRVSHLFKIGFSEPFDLGGLFYEMSLQIINNSFHLPTHIPYYSVGGLPFAYPPITFYIQAILIKVFSLGPFITVNLLPPVFSVLSLISFFFLSSKYLNTRIGIIVAFLTFATLPQAFIEQIEAQGLAESFGTLVLIWYTYFLISLYRKPSNPTLIASGIFLGINIMSGPGAAYASISISILFSLSAIIQSGKKKVFSAIGTYTKLAALGLTVSAIYWVPVINYHGLEIFTIPFLSQNKLITARSNFELLTINVFLERKIWYVTLYLCLLITAFKKKFKLLLYFFLMDFIPREWWITCIPISLIIGYGSEIILQTIQSIKKINLNIRYTVALTILGFYFIVSMLISLKSLGTLLASTDYDLPKAKASELSNISQYIPDNSSVIVAGNWGLIEWSPSILKKDVLNNHFGLEWQPSKDTIARSITENIYGAGSLDAIMDIVRENHGDTKNIYLIIDKTVTFPALDLNQKTSLKFKELQNNDLLKLVRLSR